MRALLDINVLLALFDEDHVFHQRAHDWFGPHRRLGWASCPLTENGFFRIRSNPNYHPAKRRTVSAMIEGLRSFVKASDHEFWPDDLSLRDEANLNSAMVIGPRQITDLYLLSLAVTRGGRLVTFDEGLDIRIVPNARVENLCVI